METPAAPPGGQGAPEAGCEAVLVPAGFAEWDTLESTGLGAVETGEFCRACAGGGPGRADRGAYPAGGSYGGPAGGSA